MKQGTRERKINDGRAGKRERSGLLLYLEKKCQLNLAEIANQKRGNKKRRGKAFGNCRSRRRKRTEACSLVIGRKKGEAAIQKEMLELAGRERKAHRKNNKQRK